jgi:hypothetical protein
MNDDIRESVLIVMSRDFLRQKQQTNLWRIPKSAHSDDEGMNGRLRSSLEMSLFHDEVNEIFGIS